MKCLLLLSVLVCFYSSPGICETASWYSVESCLKEGSSGITASGEPFQNDKYTCASWDYEFGTILRVQHQDKCVEVRVNDRGPSKRLYNKGRILDLSPLAFSTLAPLNKGIIDIEVSRVR